MAKILNLTTIDTTGTDYNGVSFNAEGEYIALEGGNIIIRKLNAPEFTVICKLADLDGFKSAMDEFTTLYDAGSIVQG
jgi:hypothetical protein